ncbi:hypothetical protein PVAND_011094 [Polypedilum vanderplanki]|uniref:Uncharacterized protein n=1 Tax=Polypedilum vanderplanki TaxID=319348 RepID=A0A9J6CHK4_POLVA|nr:hypothetical protein PVAND_011094 [Polypedilum vanderplanki]
MKFLIKVIIVLIISVIVECVEEIDSANEIEVQVQHIDSLLSGSYQDKIMGEADFSSHIGCLTPARYAMILFFATIGIVSIAFYSVFILIKFRFNITKKGHAGSQ